MLNKDGTPRVFYHGTNTVNGNFEIFDSSKAVKRGGLGLKALGKGNYFTTVKLTGNERYGSRIIPAYLRLTNPLILDGTTFTEGIKNELGINANEYSSDIKDNEMNIFKKIYKRLDNFWYHYKWQTMISVSFVVILSVLAAQFITKDKYDISIIYAGPENITANQTREIEGAFDSIVYEDLNGDGKNNAKLMPFFLLTEEQKEKKTEEADKNGELFAVNMQEMQNTRNSFTTHVFTGESSICLLDPEWYEMLLEQNAFVPLGQVLDSVPEYANDEYSVRLCDTEFAKSYSCLNVFPDDTLLCIRRKSTASLIQKDETEDEKYMQNKAAFCRIFGY